MASDSAVPDDPLWAAGEDLRHYAAAVARLEQTAGNEAGLLWSACEASFLALLRLHGPMTPGELGELARLSSSGTTTGAVDRLEKAGYVVRERCTRDRRKVIVSLTPDGAAGLRRAQRQRLAEVMGEYGESEQRLIAGFLARLAASEARAATA